MVAITAELTVRSGEKCMGRDIATGVHIMRRVYTTTKVVIMKASYYSQVEYYNQSAYYTQSSYTEESSTEKVPASGLVDSQLKTMAPTALGRGIGDIFRSVFGFLFGR